MPYVRISTNMNLSAYQLSQLKKETAGLIIQIQGKKPESTMVEIDDKKEMYFGLSDEPCARVRIDIFRDSPDEEKRSYAEAVCALIQQVTAIPTDRIYLTYSVFDQWGYGGKLNG